MNKTEGFIAHTGKNGNRDQTVKEHLTEVAALAADFAGKINQSKAGELIGLLHDFGKYSQAFQNYIKSASGNLDKDDDNFVDAKALKGKIDHSTAGAQWIFNNLFNKIVDLYPDKSTTEAKLAFAAAQVLSLCVASHHSGLIDCFESAYSTGFIKRIRKEDKKTHLKECIASADKEVINQAELLCASKLLHEIIECLKAIMQPTQNGFSVSELSQSFYLGMYTKFIFSCLIDADRINSADFEMPENKALCHLKKPNWDVACERTEQFIAKLKPSKPIDLIRQKISNSCKERAKDKQGIYSLTVPTGGGKTYSSLRYAVHHAKQHNLDRVIYVIPYTSIIDQNAQVIREVLERDGDDVSWVLEHHSNLEPEMQTWRSKLVSQSWDAPVVLTTMVQFLETLFSGGTRGARRFHQMANSVIVFDEIQTLPINCTHLFCNAVNFLSAHCKTTAVLCTATQPLLDRLKNQNKGQLHLSKANELMPDVSTLFDDLRRVQIVDKTKVGGWTVQGITNLVIQEMAVKQSCLVIVNTKVWALDLCLACIATGEFEQGSVFHLSTSQCPANRKLILEKIKNRLDAEQAVICFSTALIEAGVDVDFALVVRFLAGMDSIAQAAGRCNRNGRQDNLAQVYVLNPNQENVDKLIDIKAGIENSLAIFNEFQGKDLLSPEVMEQYFKYYFHGRAEEMSYSFAKQGLRDDTLLNLLSCNPLDTMQGSLQSSVKQSFMTAGKIFKVIDAPTESLIVPYGEGVNLLAELCVCAVSKEFNAEKYFDTLKKLQQYSVNLFDNVWRKLDKQGAIFEIGDDGIYCLDERFYSEEFGVSIEPNGEQ